MINKIKNNELLNQYKECFSMDQDYQLHIDKQYKDYHVDKQYTNYHIDHDYGRGDHRDEYNDEHTDEYFDEHTDTD